MLTIENITVQGNALSFVVKIENDENKRYMMSVDKNTEMLSVLRSEIPPEYKMYERQARVALMEYRGKDIPQLISSFWC